MKQITVITENKVGVLVGVCDALGSANINIDSILGEGIAETGVVRIMVEDVGSAVKVLKKRGFKVLESDVITIKVANKPGEVARIARKLAQKKVDLQYIYLLTTSEKEGRLLIKPDNFERALKALNDEDYEF